MFKKWFISRKEFDALQADHVKLRNEFYRLYSDYRVVEDIAKMFLSKIIADQISKKELPRVLSEGGMLSDFFAKVEKYGLKKGRDF